MRQAAIFTRWTALALLLLGGVTAGYVATLPASTGPAAGTGLIGTPTSRSTADTLRIGTFNIDGGVGTDGIVDLSRTTKCLQHLDVVGLQEVHGFGGDPPNQAVVIGGLLRLPYLYVPAERRWGHDSFGNAFLSDLATTRWQRVVIPSTPLHAKRNYLLADLDWRGMPLHVVTTHVDFKGNGDEQLSTVIRAFLTLPEPAILMGDLNHPADSGQIKQLLATPGVEEAVGRVLEPVPGRVDWIFLRGLRTADAGAVDLRASDHPAYWAEVRLAVGSSARKRIDQSKPSRS